MATAESKSDHPSSRGLRWLWSLVWVRGAASAIAIVGVLSTISGDATSSILAFSHAITLKWNDAVLHLLAQIKPYIPFVDRIDRYDLNMIALAFIFSLPLLVSAHFRLRKLDKKAAEVGLEPSTVWNGRVRLSHLSLVFIFGLLALLFVSVIATEARDQSNDLAGGISAIVQGGIGAWFLWDARDTVPKYFTALVTSVAVLLTLDALFYVPVIGSALQAAADWLNSR